MLDIIMEVLRDLGLVGLFLGIVIEAISIPFPAAIFLLVYGYILDPSFLEIIMLAFGSSFVYVAFSFIPYWVSIKYEPFLKKMLSQKKVSKKKVKSAERWIEKYGEWMIAVGRVLGMGYIAYIAGFSKIGPVSFGFFTFLGFFPLSLIMFYLGSLRNIEKVAEWLQNGQWIVYSIIGIALVGYFTFRWYRRKGALVTENDNGSHS